MTLAPLIGIGGTATDAKDYIANSMLPSTAKGQSIITLANNEMNNAVLKNQQILAASTGNATTPSVSTQTPTGSTPSKLGGYYTVGSNGQVTYNP